MASRINIGPENGPYVAINESSGNLQLEDNSGNVVAEWDETNAQWDFANNTLNNVDALNSNSVNTEDAVIKKPIHDIRAYGASESSTENDNAINDAIDAAEATGGSVLIPGGVWEILGVPTVREGGISIIGSGTVKVDPQDTEFNQRCLQIFDSNESTISDVYVGPGLTFDGSWSPGNEGAWEGITIGNAENVHIDWPTVKNVEDDAVDCDSVNGSRIAAVVKGEVEKAGIHISSDSGAEEPNIVGGFVDNAIIGAGRAAFTQVNGAKNNIYRDCVAIGNDKNFEILGSGATLVNFRSIDGDSDDTLSGVETILDQGSLRYPHDLTSNGESTRGLETTEGIQNDPVSIRDPGAGGLFLVFGRNLEFGTVRFADAVLCGSSIPPVIIGESGTGNDDDRNYGLDDGQLTLEMVDADHEYGVVVEGISIGL